MDEIRQGKQPVPAEERRGGDKPDWAHARPGEELPEFPDAVPKIIAEIEPDYGPGGASANG